MSTKPKRREWFIYDQFHLLRPDHIERYITGTWEEALEQYRFYRACYPAESLGITDLESFNKKKKPR